MLLATKQLEKIAEWYGFQDWETCSNDEDFQSSVTDNEVPLFDEDGNHLGYDIPSHYQSITSIILQ